VPYYQINSRLRGSDEGGNPENGAGLRSSFGVTAGLGVLILLLSFDFSRGHCRCSGDWAHPDFL